VIEFTLPLAPQAWERVTRGQFGQAYVPPDTRRFERLVGHLARRYRHAGGLLDGPLRLTARFYVQRPKRPKYTEPATRPDLDNYMKALKDGLNEVVWTDDSRVCRYGHDTGKYFADPGTLPRIEIKVEELR
jgi:Holliday junction resolvase RusA-like endonuclease